MVVSVIDSNILLGQRGDTSSTEGLRFRYRDQQETAHQDPEPPEGKHLPKVQVQGVRGLQGIGL